MQLDRSLSSCFLTAVFAFGALGGCASEASSGEDLEVGTVTNGDLPAAQPAEASNVEMPAQKSAVPALAKAPKVWDEVQIGARIAQPATR